MIYQLKKNWFVGLIILILIVALLFMNDHDLFFSQEDEMTALGFEDVEDVQNPDVTQQTETNEASIVIVDVKGEVENPGVYQVNVDARVHQVIEKAGGFTKSANENFINLAQKVHDEMIIFVPEIGEEDVHATYEDPQSNKIRINHATQEEIEQLSGIGPSKAKAIIEYREEHGTFQSVEDLLHVSGIGEKTLENIRDEIQIP